VGNTLHANYTVKSLDSERVINGCAVTSKPTCYCSDLSRGRRRGEVSTKKKRTLGL